MADIEEKELSWPMTVWEEVRGFFSTMFTYVWKDLVTAIPGLLSVAWKWASESIKAQPLGDGSSLIDSLTESRLIDANDASQIKSFLKGSGTFAGVYALIVFASVYLKYLKSGSEALTGTIVQRLNAAYSPYPPGAGSVIQAAFVAPEKTSEVRDAMKRNGLSDADIDLMFIAAYRLYDIDIVRQLFFRGALSDEDVKVRMRELGFTDTRIAEIRQGWDLIPPVADIITMAVREAFTPAVAERFGQYEDFPGDLAEWGKKQGLSEEWTKRYWAAHWQLPSPQMGFEMLHRGIVEKQDLELLLRAQDVMPFWREKLVGISFNPYTRVDVRRMHSMGVLNDQDLLRAYKDIGYDDEHAAKMQEFTIQYNNQDKKTLTKARILKAYQQKLTTATETRELLESIGFKENTIDFEMAMVDWDELLDIQTDVLKSIEANYTNNLIDKNEANDRLNKLNLSGEKISALFERWEVKRYQDQKIPSKTDLDKMLKAKIINEDQYRGEMTRLGYGWQYVDWYLSLIKKGK